MKLQFKLSAIATSLSVIALSLIPARAMATPGHAYSSRNLEVGSDNCSSAVRSAVKRVSRDPGTVNQISGTTFVSIQATAQEFLSTVLVTLNLPVINPLQH
ncbi:hypothetical protein [Phormidesmis priestleyi]